MEHFGSMVNNILFASDYPHWDSDDPDFALPNILPDEIKAKIQYENGRALYNL
jgi:predicted TIM-barrel fold metal-dependent hydrolase